MTKSFPQISYNQHALRVLEFDRVREIVASLAASEEGRTRLSALVPLDDNDMIRVLLEEVAEFMEALRFDDPLPEMSVNDIRELYRLMKVKGSNLGIEGIAAVADNLELARLTRNYFEERTEKYPVSWGIAGSLKPLTDIEKEIRRVITPDLTIADKASPELSSLRRRLVHARNSLRDLVENTLAKLSDDVVAERLITIRNGRFVIPVRDSMKKRVTGAVHDRSQTGKTLFIEPMAAIEGNNLICELELAERAEIERIIVELSSRISDAANDIEHNQEVLVRMDVIKAKARYGVTVEGVIPHINDEHLLNIKKGRHPLLDWKWRKSGGSDVVPMDIDLGGSQVTVVITGPNAGGKTVALKTIGLLTAMGLSGLPVPAAPGTAVFSPSGLFADIGDEQSIDNDLSTFSSHMQQIVTILNEAVSGSLVLLDELGSATNPSDGEAIALSVLEKLTRTGALSFATTHHEGLKVFAHETEGVINASMEFDHAHLRPTFVFRTGVPGSSYAFEIAGRMGMPQDILNRAETLTGGEGKRLEGLITEMDEHVRQADEARKASQAERMELEVRRMEYERKLEKIAEKREELLSEAVAESQQIVDDVNRKIESAIKTIREQNASHDAIVKAKSLVDRAVEDVKKASAQVRKKDKKKKRKPVGELKYGMTVWAESLENEAVVEKVLDGGRKARIRVGKSKASVVVNTSDLSAGDSSGKKPEQTVVVSIASSRAESFEIDLRGTTFDEAHIELDMFLDRLHVEGSESAHIIHGKGTGALRKKIGVYLDKHPCVESWRLGNWNEGSTGVTVVTLKK